ncbi:MAG: helix-turn-helix domain-containing protein [Bacteroidaceae bacterium]|nr:helix-turn-helix domain-containing protein [Bacteroidaceae bacterium]
MKALRIVLILLLLLTWYPRSYADEGKLYTSSQLTSSLITAIVQDHQGYIWVGTQNGLNRFDGYSFTSYLYKTGNTSSLCHNFVSTLFVDSDGQLWVGTVKGLARYNAATDDFTRFDIRPDSDDEPRIITIVESAQGQILVGTSGFGLYEVGLHDTDIRQIDRYSADDGNDYYWGLLYDSQGRLWKSDNNGTIYCFSADKQPQLLLRYQPTTGVTFTFLQDAEGNVIAISKLGGVFFDATTLAYTEQHTDLATLSSAMIGNDGNLLLGTTGYGLWRFGLTGNPREPIFLNSPNIDATTANITAVFEDNQQNLWVGCNQRGLLFYPNKQQAFQNWSLSSNGLSTARVVESITHASDGGLWAAFGDGNLYHFDPKGNISRSIDCPSRLHCIHRDRQGSYWAGIGSTLYTFNESTGKLEEVKTFDGDYLQSITDDGQGHLYLSTFSKGMTVYDIRTQSTRNYDMFQRDDPRGYLCNNWVFTLLLDSQGLLWIATSSGVSCYNPEKDTFNDYGWHNILEGYVCNTLAEGPDGNILIGTDRGLYVFNRQQNEATPFHGAEELEDKTIESIVCLQNGDVWMSTSMGIWHYIHSSGQLLGYINDNGLREREYIRGVQLQMNDGSIVFGNSSGLVAFKPDHVVKSQQKPGDIHLTSLRVGGQTINVHTLSNGDVITSEPVTQSKSFTLSYLDNSFTMEFSTFDYADASNMVLEYRLDDAPFTEKAIGDNVITFSHLQPGTYRLYVRAEQNGQYSAMQTYTITIRAPWYNSTTAWILYCLALILLLSYISWHRYRIRQQQMAEEKMRFLINATHDIRTPLTLILSPLHKAMKIVETNSEPSTLLSQLQTIDHNARRILGLVNQILDIRKIDKKQMRLQCEPTEMVSFINNIYKVFESHAHEHSIQYIFRHSDEVEAWIDRIQFDKVIQNLLSNAFKFTPDNGIIILDLQSDQTHITISVTDTGTGLCEDDIPKLFKRFYQSASNQALGKEGTGIGLNLSQMIVEMHHGTIKAQNRQDGQQGSQFIVTLPVGNSHLSSEEIKATSASNDGGNNVQPQKKPKTGHRIMLVDDDTEITDYITSELSDQYHFHSCQNGKEALHELLSDDKHYDLVVSDIMMPEMDGFTLLRTIKSNTKLSHLPVILLTSESAVGNRLEGLQQGADAFLAKPFLIDELHVTINNLLTKSKRLKDKFSGAEQERNEQVEQRDVADNDKQLMDRIMQSIDKNLSNSEFSVEQLAADAGLSRSQLHRRMKELTGISPSEFIRNLRLEQAARLLRERKTNISQVAYSLGFNTPGNFSKAFKQHFGMAPTEFTENNT